MNNSKPPPTRQHRRRAARIRRLINAALFAFIPGAATAVGSAVGSTLIAFAILWLTHHP